MNDYFLNSALIQFKAYKTLADKTFNQIDEEGFYYKPNEVSNNLANIITHMHGNMLSRWTNFLTEDGEKEWRKRDEEFEDQKLSKEQLLNLWDDGWKTLFNALEPLTPQHLDSIVYIRTEPHTVTLAILRQLAHYASHVGQIIYLGKIITGSNWQTLSIAKGESKSFNDQMKKTDLIKKHFYG